MRDSAEASVAMFESESRGEERKVEGRGGEERKVEGRGVRRGGGGKLERGGAASLRARGEGEGWEKEQVEVDATSSVNGNTASQST